MSLALDQILEKVCSNSNSDIYSDCNVEIPQKTKRDKLGRTHIVCKRTGPLILCIRNGIFRHLTMEVFLVSEL